MDGTTARGSIQEGQHSHEEVRCKTCRRTLTVERDRQKSKRQYWKNCFSCRSRNSTRKRQRRHLEGRRRLQNLIGLSQGTPGANPSVAPSGHVAPDQQECVVCSDSFSDGQLARLEACSHSPQICEACFSKWLTEQVTNNSSDRIACPSDGCTVTASQDDVKKHATPEVYTR